MKQPSTINDTYIVLLGRTVDQPSKQARNKIRFLQLKLRVKFYFYDLSASTPRTKNIFENFTHILLF